MMRIFAEGHMPNSTVDSQSLESGFPVWTLPLTGCVDSALLILRVSYSKWASLQLATVWGDGLWSGTLKSQGRVEQTGGIVTLCHQQRQAFLASSAATAPGKF